MTNVDERLIEAQFFSTMEGCGIKTRDSFIPVMDGLTHRFAVEGDRGSEKSGAYFIHADDCPNWGIMDYHKHHEMQKFSFDFSAITIEERRQYALQRDSPEQRAITEREHRQREREKAEESKRHEEKVRQAMTTAFKEYCVAGLDIWRHDYIKQRFIQPDIVIPDNGKYGIFRTVYDKDMRIIRFPLKLCTCTIQGGKCEPGQLLVPMIDLATDNFKTLIRVMPKPTPEGKFMKPNYPTISPTGSAFILAPDDITNSETLFVCEGFCTALAVFILSGGNFPVFSAGSCGNLIHVCKALRKRYENRKIIIMADNDDSGIKAANQCREEGYSDGIKTPPVKGADWYDFLSEHRKAGY